MRYDILASVMVAALVVLAGAAGGAVAAPAATTGQADRTVQQADDEDIDVSSMRVENLTTSIEMSATLTVESDDTTEEVTVSDATVDLTEATVVVENATISDNGTVDLESARVIVVDGTVEIQTDAGTQAIDLTGTDTAVEDQRLVIDDIVGSSLGLSETDLGDGTISELTVEDVSATADTDLLVVNIEGGPDVEDQNISVVVDTGTVSVEGLSMTMTNATFTEDGLEAESVNASADQATVEAERVVLLQELTVTESEDVSVSVQDATLNETDVQIPLNDPSALIDLLLGSGAVAATTS